MKGYFDSMRQGHPLKLGDIIDGKPVVLTCFKGLPAVPIFRLEGEVECRGWTPLIRVKR